MYYGSAFVVVCTFFDKSLHVGSSDLTILQSFKSAFLTVFQIPGLKLKKNNDNDKNW